MIRTPPTGLLPPWLVQQPDDVHHPWHTWSASRFRIHGRTFVVRLGFEWYEGNPLGWTWTVWLGGKVLYSDLGYYETDTDAREAAASAIARQGRTWIA